MGRADIKPNAREQRPRTGAQAIHDHRQQPKHGREFAIPLSGVDPMRDAWVLQNCKVGDPATDQIPPASRMAVPSAAPQMGHGGSGVIDPMLADNRTPPRT